MRRIRRSNIVSGSKAGRAPWGARPFCVRGWGRHGAERQTGGSAGLGPHLGIPAAQYNCHPERAARAEESPFRNRCCLGWQGLPSFCHPDGARRAIGGISNPEPLLPWKAEPCLGADHTKESLSFERQPSLFKGRNQSWFHPLRTPSRPGAAAPGPHGGQRAGGGAFAYHLPAAMHRPPAARCYHPIVFVLLFENKAGFCLR